MALSFDGFNDPDRGGGIFSNAIDNQSRGPIAGFGGGGSDGVDTAYGGNNFLGKGGYGSLAIGGLQTLGSIWNSFQQMKLAKKTLKFQKNAFRTNLADNRQVYNTALEDRIRARYATEGRSGEADARIAETRLGGSGQPTGRRITLEE